MATFLRRSKIIPSFDIKKINDFVTLSLNRFIMTSMVRFEKVFEDLQRNPYFNKYAQKIAKLQHTSPEEFLHRIEETERKIKEKKDFSSNLKSTSKLQRSWISFETWKLNAAKKQIFSWSWISFETWKLNTVKKHSIIRAYSQLASKYKYITTPIFYVNADPHIGHLYTAILADSITRFNLMQGHVTLLNTGTDEHGTKVQKAAKSCSLPTEQYCKMMSQTFKKMCDAFKINYTNFIKTTESSHYETVQYFWRLLEERNHIYKGKYSGWYCVSEEAFLSNQDLIEKETSFGEIIKVSMESGHVVEWTEEENYKFQLSKFQNDLKYWMKDERVVQPSCFHKILSQWIEDGSCLEDLSISRPVKRVAWGIPTPNDQNQTVYVWFDALVNYLTSLGYPNNKFKKFWPPTVQVIGKDILKFHGIYWPAFLLAAGLEPPKTLLCHSHWTIDHKKMSKSIGNVVSPFVAAQQFTTDGLRYFLLRTSNMSKDCNYSTENVLDILNSDLANTMGNLVSRCTGKLVNPLREIPSPTTYARILTSDSANVLRKNIESLGNTAQEYYESFKINFVVDAVMTSLRSANVMIDYHKPWILRRESHDTAVVAELKSVIALALETTRISAIVLYPVIPQLSSNILDYLNVPKNARSWKDTKPKYLNSLKSIKSESLADSNSVLFPKIKLKS